VVNKDINVDWTNPSMVATLNDGTGIDIDTTTNGTELQANWLTAVDANSDIKNYYYAIGTVGGAADIVPWTMLPLGTTSVTASGLSLVPSQKYYVSVRSENFAGMRSAILTTDGQVYDNGTVTGMNDLQAGTELTVFPNPSNGEFRINYPSGDHVNITVANVIGEIIYETRSSENSSTINLNGQAQGVYYVTVTCHDKQLVKKIILKK
jgi:hypothetical protein